METEQPQESNHQTVEGAVEKMKTSPVGLREGGLVQIGFWEFLI